ncbi:hypothetical protein ACHAPJ_013296 [Fusarium lateritium]
MAVFYSANWSNEMTINSSWLINLKDNRDDPSIRFLVYYNGLETDFNEEINSRLKDCIKEIEEKKSLREQLKDRTLQEKSTRFLHETLVAQWSEETQRVLPSNAMFRIYTSFSFTSFQSSTGETKDSIVEIISILKKGLVSFKAEFKGEEGSIRVSWIHSGGKSNEKGPRDSAYPWRGCVYHTYIMIEWKEKWLETSMRKFLETLNEQLRKYSMNELGVYVNFPDETMDKNTYEKAYYGENREELQRIKAVWDKKNIFGWPHGVQVGPHADDADAIVFAPPPPPPSDAPVCRGFVNAGDMVDKFASDGWPTHAPDLGSTLVRPGIL